MVRVGPAYQASVSPLPHHRRTPEPSAVPSVGAFLRRCALSGIAFAGSDGAREELCIETLASCDFDEDRAMRALSSGPHVNRYDHPPPSPDRHTTKAKGAVREGDCVFLRSPPNQEPYVALVEKAHANGSLTCRWFYRHADLDPACMSATDPSPLELFLSPVRNRNDADKVLGLCAVGALPNGKTHFCRSMYIPQTRRIVATRRVRALQARKTQRKLP